MNLQNKIELVDYSIGYSKIHKLKDSIFALEGLTSKRSQSFLNILTTELEVLEIGTFCGASTIAIAENAINVTTIDNWCNIEVESVDKKYKNSINNPKEVFEHNKKYYNNILSLDGDIFSESIFSKIITGNFDAIFYDGPHDVVDIYTFFMLYEQLFKHSILVIDDYNFNSVKEGIKIGLEAISINYARHWIIETDGESLNTFWNGMAIFVFE